MAGAGRRLTAGAAIGGAECGAGVFRRPEVNRDGLLPSCGEG